MEKTHESIKKIDEILNNTILTIENSRNDLLDIVEITKKEYEDIKEELEYIKEKARKAIKEVDVLEGKERKSRYNLAKVSKDFKRYTENDIRKAYEYANDLRMELALKREEEKNLLEKRKELEIRLKETFEVLMKAKNITKQVGVAMGYLKGNLNDILIKADDLNKKQYLGIKIIEAQEEERHRLARDIHDGPAQSLASIAIKAELSEKLLEKEPLKAKEELNDLKIVTRNTLKEIRKIIYDLRPMSLDDLGLKPTLDRHVYNFMKNTGINVELKVIGEINKLDSAIEIALFRIIQEGLNNVLRHSKANNVNIMIENTEERINMSISDNGIGFNIKEKMESVDYTTGGYGLMSMKERVEMLGGEITIRSFPGRGTRIFLHIPLSEGDFRYEQ